MNPFTKNEDRARQKALGDLAREWAQLGIRQGKNLGKNLAFSRESIRDLDQVIDLFHQEIQRTGSDPKKTQTLTYVFGAYLGEALLDNKLRDLGYTWTRLADKSNPLLFGQGAYLDPMERVRQRLEEEDSPRLAEFFLGIVGEK